MFKKEIKQIIKNSNDKKPTAIKTLVNSVLMSKIRDVLERKKIEISKEQFSK